MAKKKNKNKPVKKAPDRKERGREEARKPGKDWLKEEREKLRRARAAADKLGLSKPLDRIDTSSYEEATRVGRSKDISGALDDYRARAAEAGRRSQEMSDTIALMKQGLAGLSATENQALRETAAREVDRQFQSAQRNLANAQARSQIGSAAAAAQVGSLGSQRGAAQSQMEQDLLVKNIDIQDKRRGAYANLLGGQEEAEFGRGRMARADYVNLLGGQEEAEFVRGTKTREDLLNAQKVNLAQQRAEQAANLAATTGIAGLAGTAESEAKQLELAREGLRRGGGGNSSGGGYDSAAYLAALKKLGEDQFGELPEV